MSTLNRVPVKVITEHSQASLLFDPIRREILRLLSKQALTQKQLADILHISAPSVDHHLKSLIRGQFIAMVRKEAGSHGIVQKWYMATAQVFIVDRDQLPNEVRRYFMPIDIERTRVLIACISLMKNKVRTSTQTVENLTGQIGTLLTRAAHNYRGGLEDDPERVWNKLYIDAFKETVEDSSVQRFITPRPF